MGKAKSTERRGKPNTSPYHVFFQRELKRVKQENPNMTHKEAFKQAGLNWKNSPENPKNKAPAPSNDQVPAGSSEKAPQAPAASLESSVPSNEQAQTTPFTASASSDAKEDVLAPPPKLPSPQSEQGGAANPQKLSANEHPASAAAASAEIETAEPKVAESEPAETSFSTANPAESSFMLHAGTTSSGNLASNTTEAQERTERSGAPASGFSSMAAHSVSLKH
ncbi:hypothetical protein LPJ55_004116 [Coemansia sp. RSA 990]|nr:hypothetical protein LPJ55_004116 [Coemansia sp. RSA 990]